MTTPLELHQALAARLKTLSSITVYEDGDVPSRPPADAQGRVFPYAVLWPASGAPAGESSVAGQGGLDWHTQVTVAAGDLDWLLQASQAVRQALVGHVLVAGVGPLVDETPATLFARRDPDVSPIRWFVPVLLGCLAP